MLGACRQPRPDELSAVPVSDGSAPYLAWVSGETAGA
jgi:hypothetical protein